MSEFPADPGNPFLTQSYPSNIAIGQIQTAAGPHLLVTFRSGPCTLTMLLSKQDAQNWGAMLTEAGSKISSLIIAPVIPPNLANGQMN